jgi:hypothetical protein
MTNLVADIETTAEEHPDATAIAANGREITCREFWSRTGLSPRRSRTTASNRATGLPSTCRTSRSSSLPFTECYERAASSFR